VTADDDPVRRALAAVAEADRSRHAPPHLERAVLEALDARMARGPFRRWMAVGWPYRHAAAAIAVMALTLTMYFGVEDEVSRPRSPAAESASFPSSLRPVRNRGAFAVHQGEIAQRLIVRLPRTMLPMLGVPVINPDAPGTVNLEVTVGHDGLAHTIRILP
jgi:hypothetical protein